MKNQKLLGSAIFLLGSVLSISAFGYPGSQMSCTEVDGFGKGVEDGFRLDLETYPNDSFKVKKATMRDFAWTSGHETTLANNIYGRGTPNGRATAFFVSDMTYHAPRNAHLRRIVNVFSQYHSQKTYKGSVTFTLIDVRSGSTVDSDFRSVVCRVK